MDESEVMDFPIDRAMYITGDKPIRACLYKKSTRITGGSSSNSISDPFLILYPPKEQFLRKYNVICVDVRDVSNNPAYTSHYINAIVPSNRINTLEINGNPVNPNLFTDIPGIGYSFANIKVPSGTHKVTADTTFGICVYGYGQTNSYGYVGGLGLEVMDWTPPQVEVSDSCETGNVLFTEFAEHDGGMDTVVVTENINTLMNLSDSSRSIYSASFELNDKFEDGKFAAYAVDTLGSTSRAELILPGYTFTLEGNYYNLIKIIDTTRFDSKKCIDLEITNYGFLDKTVDDIFLSLADDIYLENLPPSNEIKAGETITIQACYESGAEPKTVIDTLNLSFGCNINKLAVIGFYQAPDSANPSVTTNESDCKDELTIKASEDLATDYGMGEYEIINLENLEVSDTESDFQKISLDLKLTDPYQDGLYEIRFTDLAGNDTTINGIVQGFTISASPQVNEEAQLVFETQKVGNTICGEITLTNYGLLPLTFDDVFVTEKLNFFIPQSQLPITIEPDSSKKLTICFMSAEVTNEMLEDILKLDFNCLTKDIRVLGDVEEFQMSGTAACDYNVKFVFGETPGSIYLDNSYPNPTNNSFTARFGTNEDRNILLKLIDTKGNQYDIFEDNYQEGSYELEVDVSNLPAGIYFLEMISGKKRLTNSLVIER